MAAVKSVLFLVDYRDAETLTLEMTKVPDIRKLAKELGVVLQAGMRKPELIDKLVQFQCRWLSFGKVFLLFQQYHQVNGQVPG